MTARPGRLKAQIDIGLPRPRDVLAMESDPEFLRLHALVWNHLREEVLAAGEHRDPPSPDPTESTGGR